MRVLPDVGTTATVAAGSAGSAASKPKPMLSGIRRLGQYDGLHAVIRDMEVPQRRTELYWPHTKAVKLGSFMSSDDGDRIDAT